MSEYELTTDELIEKADHLEEVGELNSALLYWRAAVNRESDPIMLCRLGNVAMELGDLVEAEQAFLSAIQLAPHVPNAHNMLGLLYLERGQLESAYGCFRQSAELQGTARTLTLLGSVQLQIGLRAEARESLSRALEVDPTYEEAHYNLGLTFRHDQPEVAIALFRKALDLDSDYALAHRELGWALQGLTQLPEAEYHIRRALELDDSDGWAHVYLGNLLWTRGELPAAEQAFLTATRVWPDNSVPHWCLARFYECQGRKEEADLFYEKALELDPDDPQANLRFGFFLKEIGEGGKARVHLERALKSDPDNEYARSLLFELDDASSVNPPSRSS